MADDTTTQPSRDDIRAAIFSKKKPKAEIIDFFGQKVEVRQMPLGTVLDAKEGQTTKQQMITMIINYCYVPGTNEKIFELADEEGLLELPWGADFNNMQRVINELLGIDIGKAEKNSSTSPSGAES